MAAAREEGIVKVFAEDYNARNKVSLFVGRTNIVFPDASKTNLSLAPHIPFGEGNVRIKSQSYLRIYLEADAADTLDYTDMKDCVQIPLTLIKDDTKTVEKHLLQIGDIELSSDPTTVASTDIKVGEYQIPVGYTGYFGIPASEDSLMSRLVFIPMDDTT